MDATEKIDYRHDMAAYDLETARAMFQTGRYLQVGFICHQVVEKALKGYFWRSKLKEPPFAHNLLLLAEESELQPLINDQYHRLLRRLMPLKTQARYPQYKDDLL